MARPAGPAPTITASGFSTALSSRNRTTDMRQIAASWSLMLRQFALVRNGGAKSATVSRAPIRADMQCQVSQDIPGLLSSGDPVLKFGAHQFRCSFHWTVRRPPKSPVHTANAKNPLTAHVCRSVSGSFRPDCRHSMHFCTRPLAPSVLGNRASGFHHQVTSRLRVSPRKPR